jgi:hypothetical protein
MTTSWWIFLIALTRFFVAHVQKNLTQLVTMNEVILITQPTNWQQTITPIVPSHANNVSFPSYPMWYNVIPPYLFLDSNLYPRYFNGMKMFELLNARTTAISMAWYPYCRNPTLAKCGGEAQHLAKLGIWSPSELPNVRSSTARPKTLCNRVFLMSLKRSWNVDIENGLPLVI